MTDTADVSITIEPVNDPPVAPDDAATMERTPAPPDRRPRQRQRPRWRRPHGRGYDRWRLGRRRHHRRRHGADLSTERPVPRHGHVHLYGLRRDRLADGDRLGHRHLGERQAGRRRRRLRGRRGRGGHALAVLAGDTDLDLDTLTIVSATQGSKGAVVITGGGTGLTYRPFSNLSGMDSFTYTISDGHGETDTASVTMTIGGETTRRTRSTTSVSTCARARGRPPCPSSRTTTTPTATT